MGEYNDEYYYQKYLKYKNKYLELKQYEGGGIETGVYAYFCNKAQADRICSDPKFGKTTTSYNINKILSEDKNFVAYKGIHGDTKLTRITQYTTVKATKATMSAATATGSAVKTAATATGTAAKTAATATGTAARYAATAVMNRGSKFASGIATTAGKLTDRATDFGKTVGERAIKKISPKQGNLLIGGGDEIVLNLFDKTTNTKKVLDFTDEEYLLNIVKLLRRKSGDAHKTIDSVVIINYSPMGKNICNKKITFTTNQLMDKSAVEALMGVFEQVTTESPQEKLRKKMRRAAVKERQLLNGQKAVYQNTDSESDERQDEI
jgi:hypothetical protein